VKRSIFAGWILVTAAVTAPSPAQVKDFKPVTQQMLLKPNPGDWLMYSRTYDAQRFSPLSQINGENAGTLAEAWSKPLDAGTIESIPLVHDGVLYAMVPRVTPEGTKTAMMALNGATGELLWEYIRPTGGMTRSKSFGVFEDLIIFTGADNFIVAVDAATGELRWETESSGGLTAGAVIAGDQVITGRTCGTEQTHCYIAAHDAKTGKESWRFYTAAGRDDPAGDATWAGVPEATRVASTWGLGGSYDPVNKMIYWGVANPSPYTRLERHGAPDAVSLTAPVDLYSNSTVAISVETGKLSWYYQHLPGDDWDQDYTNERILLRTPISPDRSHVKWANPDVPEGELHDVAVNVGEGGGIFVLDRISGQFLWANPFPYDVENFLISDIDPKTGRTTINFDAVIKAPGERKIICAYNTKSYWPMSYHPGNNSLYVPYVDDCLDMTSASADGAQRQRRVGIRRPGSDPAKYAGIAKINVETGKLERIYEGAVPGNGATLVTAGNLLFWGDLDQKFRAFDADNGKILWETKVSGPIQNSTITYAVNGKQYVAVVTGTGLMTRSLFGNAGIDPELNNAIHVFALP
jgi:alcohol dehydrogenase (cytochrome c)